MKKAIAFIIAITALASCTKRQEAMLSDEAQQAKDSTTLRVAVLPTMGCLPIFYAERVGLLDSLGLDVKLMRYQAQMDIDTAIARRRVHVAYSDLIRAIRLQAAPFLATDEPLSFISQKNLHVKKVKQQISEKMIAIARLSVTDFWCDQMLDSAKMDYALTHRPQINDVMLRARMLQTGLMDAVIVPEPYATWLIREGHTRHYRTGSKDPWLTVWIAAPNLCSDSLRINQIRLFAQAYQLATEQIHDGMKEDITRAILIDEFCLPKEVADSISLPKQSNARLPKQKDVEAAAAWLKGRDRLPKDFTPKGFILSIN